MGLFRKSVTALARGVGLSDYRMVAYFGGEYTDAGEAVTVEGSLGLDTVWACVRLISQVISTLPFPLYKKDAEGFGVPAVDHPLYRVLHDQPNYDMTACNFWEAMVGCLLLWGNAFAKIERGGLDNRDVMGLRPLRPDNMVPRLNADGTITYIYTWNGTTEEFPEDEILHIKGFSLDGYCGLSPIAQARQTLGSARAAERASGAIFRNGMRPSGYLKSAEYLTPEQRESAKGILEGFKGAANTGGVPLLEGGWDFTSLSIPPEDAQLLETRAFHVEQICRWFDVPPVMVGHSSTTTWGSGIEQLMLWFLQSCLRSHLKRIEQAVHKACLRPEEKGTYYAEFNIEGLLRADSAARAQLYSALAQNGIMDRNEIRGKENLPKRDGAGDLTVQSNLVPLKDLATIAEAARLKLEKPQGMNDAPPSDKTPGGVPAAPIPVEKKDALSAIDLEALISGFRDSVIEAVKSQPQQVPNNVTVPVHVVTKTKKGEVVEVHEHDEHGRIKRFSTTDIEG